MPDCTEFHACCTCKTLTSLFTQVATGSITLRAAQASLCRTQSHESAFASAQLHSASVSPPGTGALISIGQTASSCTSLLAYVDNRIAQVVVIRYAAQLCSFETAWQHEACPCNSEQHDVTRMLCVLTLRVAPAPSTHGVKQGLHAPSQLIAWHISMFAPPAPIHCNYAG